MSHFSNLSTQIENINYLQKALENLQVVHKKKATINIGNTHPSDFSNGNLVITDVCEIPISFQCKKDKYVLVVDNQFWKPSFSVELFLEKITQQYARETIIGESEKSGYTLSRPVQTTNESTVINLQKWKLVNDFV
jgi:hypothetical protein|tara:strand:+ start:11366 stop:11773 length:408 start_codon:yes stop_codon:yes gene_type:complete